jgi:hypothetical protein
LITVARRIIVVKPWRVSWLTHASRTAHARLRFIARGRGIAMGETSCGHRPGVLHWHTLRDQRHRGPRRSSCGLGRGRNRWCLPQPRRWRHLDAPRDGFVRPGYSRRDDRGDAAQAPICQYSTRSVYQQRSGGGVGADAPSPRAVERGFGARIFPRPSPS